MIDRYHLRYFLAVVDTGNFSRAAIACNVSQPTLSVGIGKLEKSLGKALFNRSNRRVELTEAGTRLLSHARLIEANFASAEREVAQAASLPTLRLGVLTTIPRHWIERFLILQGGGGRGHRIEIVEGQERDLRGKMDRGRIDAALTILREGDHRSVGHHIVTDGFSLALSTAHRLAGRAIVRAEELADDAMILRRHCELLPETSRFFTARGIRPFFSSRTISDDKALAYVRAGQGVTVMPNGFREAGVTRIPLDGFDFTRDIGILFARHADGSAREDRQLIDNLIGAVEEKA